MHKIEWTRRRRSVRLDARRVGRVLTRVLGDGGFPPGVVSVAVVGDDQMRRLNAASTGDQETTDVLSFPMGQDDCGVVAEIVINADAAASAAPRYGNTPSRELALYAVHGALHLVGYDDRKEPDRRRMQRAQRKYLALLPEDAAVPGKNPASPSSHVAPRTSRCAHARKEPR